MAKYKFFERLGLFGLAPGTRQDATRFLEMGKAVLSRPAGAFWLAPQGALRDTLRPIVVESGIGHLVRHMERFATRPVAFEYSFWNEHFPEAFACFGHPVLAYGVSRRAADWNALFTRSVQETVHALSARVELRDASLFEPLLTGNSGMGGGIYDLWRFSKARLRGKHWEPEHGGN